MPLRDMTPRPGAADATKPALRALEPLPGPTFAGLVDALAAALVLEYHREFSNEPDGVVDSPRRVDHDQERAA
jgi:hypothetical protein